MASVHFICHGVTLTIIAVLAHKWLNPVTYNGLASDGTDSVPQESIAAASSRPGKGADIPVTASEPPDPVFSAAHRDLVNTGSAVWCSGSSRHDRICLFRNLCYLSNRSEFLFFHGENSILENFPRPGLGEDESSILELSSVADHNKYFFDLIHLPSEAAETFPLLWILRRSLVFGRFKPDNLMHVLHDDILPLHHTLGMISSISNRIDKYNVQLVFMDHWDGGMFPEIYQSFSLYRPLCKQDLRALQGLTCFKEVYVGLSKATIWYQYGFSRPQGPAPESQVTAREIHRTAGYVRRQLHGRQSPEISSSGRYLLLLSRKETRLLVNEDELSFSIAAEFKVKVIHISSEKYQLKDLIDLATYSMGLIGMHGALMSLAMFLKPGSIVIELFPYAISPTNYTPYKTLANLQGMGITYRTWSNKVAVNSYPHPDWSSEHGGILHLPIETQEIIQSETEVPPHLCCSDPSWLYRIYQDTKVNVADILELIGYSFKVVEILKQQGIYSDNKIPQIISSSKVGNLQCTLTVSTGGAQFIHVTWDKPWNVQFLKFTKIHYELLVQNRNQEEHTKYLLSKHEYSLPLTNEGDAYFIWVRSVLDNVHVGPFASKLDC